MVNQLKFGVVGIGHIGQRHINAIRENEAAELIAVCDNRVKEVAVPSYDSLTVFLEEEKEIEVVCVCTPNGLHTQQAIQILESGKHVVIEKPMGLTKVSCEQVIHKSLQTGKKVFVVMQLRFNPLLRKVKELIASGQLGKVYLVQTNCFWNRNEAYYKEKDWRGTIDMDGGVLFTQFAHIIDALYWMFGDLEVVHAFASNNKQTDKPLFFDTGSVQMKTGQNTMLNLCFSTASFEKNFENTISIVGEKGSVKIGGQYLDKLIYCHPNNILVSEMNKPQESGHSQIVQNVINAVTNNSKMMTNAFEGMKVVKIIEDIYNTAWQAIKKNPA